MLSIMAPGRPRVKRLSFSAEAPTGRPQQVGLNR